MLQYPVFCPQIGFLSRPLNITHAGLGFFDQNDSSKQFIIQYDTSPFNYTFHVKDWLIPRTVFNKTTQLSDFEYDLKMSVYVNDSYGTGKCDWEIQDTVANDVSGQILNEWTRDFAQFYYN